MESSSDIDRLTSQTDPDTELSFSELDSMKTRIGTIWTDISSLMNKYHAQLVLKHQKLDPLSPPVNTRSNNQKSSTEQLKKCQKEVSSLQSRLLEKDSEIVKLRSEIQKFRNVLMVKDNLIEKIQNQMTQEALDYHSEITALKEMLEEKERASEGQELLQEPPVPVAITVAQSAKRRRVGANESVAPKRPTVSSLISSTPPARRASSSSTQAATSKTSVRTPGQSSRGKSPSSPRGELPSSPDGAAADMDSGSDGDDDDDGVDDDFELDEAGDLSQLNLKEVKDLTEEQGNAQQPRNVKPASSDSTNDKPEPDHGDENERDDKLHKCRLCSYRTTRRGNLTRHVNVVHGDAPKIRYQCDSCDKSFSTKAYLQSHTSTEHELDETICDLCSEVLPNESRLLQHLRKEHNLGDHVCEFCGAAQVTRRELEIHKRKHTGERPYVCPWCGDAFRARRSRARHRLVCSKNPNREEIFCVFVRNNFRVSVH